MFINFLSKPIPLVDRHEIEKAAAVEASIVNHCRANMTSNTDRQRALKIMSVEKAAMQRYEILMEML